MCRTYMLPWDPVNQTRRPDSGAHGSADIIYLLLFEATGIIGVTILLLESLSRQLENSHKESHSACVDCVNEK